MVEVQVLLDEAIVDALTSRVVIANFLREIRLSALWCYQCVSNEPGCGREFNWWWHWTKICPEDDDICVKIIERKDSQEVITRACLSTIRGYRTDIPADHYEGCRTAPIDYQLGHYVNNSIKELDVHRYLHYFERYDRNFIQTYSGQSEAPATKVRPTRTKPPDLKIQLLLTIILDKIKQHYKSIIDFLLIITDRSIEFVQFD
ncbi:atilla isoform b-related-related [Holotrichia oblita]|uniref:Atilla isoform b-related-related n=1 Tax=Holotrichia oblita TaxID=644536 RepID=A0ACB9SSK6_HOLOL|nr:atilla isoform b-related-related [Holotrichia oblita]